MSKRYWLEGYYPAAMPDFDQWAEAGNSDPTVGDVWFAGGLYNEQQARKVLREKPHGIFEGVDNA